MFRLADPRLHLLPAPRICDAAGPEPGGLLPP